LDLVDKLKKTFLDYRSRHIGVEELQAAIWSAAQLVTAVEEKELRRFLQNAESRLDLLRFTVDETALFDKALKLVSEIEDHVQKWG
jgi:hypothetical protein